MDCNTARMLLAFARPQANDLDAVETAELEKHLAGCSECKYFAARQRGFDEAVGRVVRKVDVPDRLNPRLHDRLRADVAAPQRQRLVWRFAAAAILLLSLGGGLLAWSFWPKPRFDGEQIWANLQVRPGPDEIEKYYRDQGYEAVVPRDLQYNYLKSPLGFAEFQGHSVPCLTFVNGEGNYATVRILSARVFDFHNQNDFHSPPDESHPKLSIEFSSDRRFAYVFVYTGRELNWLRPGGGRAL